MGKKKNRKDAKRIFTYWVNMPDSPVPAYIQLCMQTWHENIPDLEVVIINHDNLFKWIDPFFNMRALDILAPSMQSDIVEFAVLYQHGGIFLNADTIITGDIFEELEKFGRNKVYFFGYPEDKSVHLAFITCMKARNKALLSCVEQEKELLRTLFEKGTLDVGWDTFGKAIVNNVAGDETLTDYVRVLDRTETGAILEAGFMNNSNQFNNYIDFYFNNRDIPLEKVLEKIKFGAVLLHNSWTPEEYKALPREEILASGCILSKLLKHALGE